MSTVKILVVEDESIVAMDIKHRLESLDYHVSDIASSGEEAVEKVDKTNPDLILMDIVLKGEMDGIDAAQLIKDRFDIPVVYLTAYSDDKTLKRAKITGPFGYIIKPFEDQELHSAIEVALYKHMMESKLKENEKWYYTILESIGDAVITSDKEGKVTFMNPVAQEVTGWNLEDSLGKSLKDVYKIVNEDTKSPIEVGDLQHVNNPVRQLDSTLLITKEGSTVPIQDTCSPIKDEKGNINGTVLVFQDIRERKKAEKEKDELLKESARSELFSFLLSAVPVFASNIPPQIRNNIAISFGDRFEKNMKLEFEKYLDKFSESDNKKVFKSYIGWLSEFLLNLGIETETLSKENVTYLRFLNCPWDAESENSPMFCLICRVIVIRSFTWIPVKGNVEQISCMADGANKCGFEFIISRD